MTVKHLIRELRGVGNAHQQPVLAIAVLPIDVLEFYTAPRNLFRLGSLWLVFKDFCD